MFESVFGDFERCEPRLCEGRAQTGDVVREQAEPARPLGRVIVGVDASVPSRRALLVAADEARIRGAELHAVYWDHLGVAARTVILDGHPSDVLGRHSEHADLLVMGLHRYSPVTGSLLGSTSDFCARHALCPVMSSADTAGGGGGMGWRGDAAGGSGAGRPLRDRCCS
jgi:hypothetical protein